MTKANLTRQNLAKTPQGTNQIRVLMKVKNRALTLRRNADKRFSIISTTEKGKKVEVRFQTSPDSHPFYVSFVFEHKSKNYCLYCKRTADKPQLDLAPEDNTDRPKMAASDISNLFRMTMDSQRYKFQSYLCDGWFLCMTKNALELNRGAQAESVLFDLES